MSLIPITIPRNDPTPDNAVSPAGGGGQKRFPVYGAVACAEGALGFGDRKDFDVVYIEDGNE